MKKKKDINFLSKIIAKEKKNQKKIVLCHGVFDLLHIGHIKHFEEAKSYDTVNCILSVRSHIVADALYYLKQVNDSYKEMTGKDEEYATLTCFLEDYINSEGSDLEDVKDQLIRSAEECFEEEKQRKEGE